MHRRDQRDFVPLVAITFLAALIFSNFFLGGMNLRAAEESTQASPTLFLTGPYLQKPGSDEMTVRWVTSAPCDSWVEYGTTPDLGKKAFTSIDGLKTAGRVQEVMLLRLRPGTDYYYRIVSCEIKVLEACIIERGETVSSSVKQFTTFEADPKHIRFIFLNDIHNKPLLWKSLVDRVADFPYDFAMLGGDMVNELANEGHLLDDILRPAGEIFAGRTPFYFVRGNHEMRGAFAWDLKNYLTTKGDKYYYAQTIGPVRLIVLDTGEDKPDENQYLLGLADFARYKEIQRQWLEREIASSEFQAAKYRVVVHHIPIKQWLPNNMSWLPLYKKGKIDLIINGHAHGYSATQPNDERPYGILVGGGPWEGAATVIKVDANQDRLKATILRDDGQIVGRFEKKAK